jgi:hypothetical protein
MQIRAGFEMVYDCPQPTPMILNLNVHFTRVSDLVGRDDLMFDPPVPMPRIATASATGAPHRRADGSHAHLGGRDRRTIPVARRRSRRDAADARDRPAGGDAAVPARQPVLRNRSPVRHGVEALRQRPDRMGPRAGDLRLTCIATSRSATSMRG